MTSDVAGDNPRKNSGLPTRAEAVAIARKLWGTENKARSTLIEFWWGDGQAGKGKRLDLKTFWWTDWDNQKAGGVADLYLLAGMGKPGKPAWLAECQVNKSADPYPNLFNAALALDGDPDFAGRLGFDEMLCQPVIVKAIAGVGPDDCPIEDEQLVALHHAMQAKGLPKMGIDTIHEAVRHVAYRNRYHPLRPRIDALEWDQEPRMAQWLTTYLGVADTEYTRTVGSMFLVGMMARLYEPGCKMDYMLILEGPQGALKSTSAEILACGYYSDDLPDLSGDPVRASQHLRGKWVIEISDWSAFRRADAPRLKSFLSRRVEIYTPKYGRTEVHEARQCVFIGTTNKKTYLQDETGGRRFWPVVCGTIDIEALGRDRDQLLAEAKDAYTHDAHWWPDRDFEVQYIKPRQEERYEQDAWADLISTYYNDFPTTYTTIVKVARNVLKIEDRHISTLDQRRITACLEVLGWTRGDKQNYGIPWFPPGKTLI